MGDMADYHLSSALDYELSDYFYSPPPYRRITPQRAIAYYDRIDSNMRELSLKEVKKRVKSLTHG